MWVGFHDDPSFRWEGDRDVTLNRARSANATMVRAVVTWASVAPTRPADASDPFDPAYQLNDLDELVRDTQKRGMEVLLTIWGTPKWANGEKGPNVLPTRMADLTDFARALASRYSGRYPGYPFVRFWSVWNESNLQLFLSPQFDSRGKIVGPRLYAKLYAAAYNGIKAGNPRALVGLGETSSHGRDRKVPGQSDTIRPGTFARLVAQANPRLKFDAYSHHPYPTPLNQKPTQRVLWPNVSLASLPRFGQSLDVWFRRKNVPIWITEYGYETRPGEPAGVTVAQQASYLREVLTMLRNDPRVGMFVWFIWQDSRSSLWQSGMIALDGQTKPSLSVYAKETRPLDARNPVVQRSGRRATRGREAHRARALRERRGRSGDRHDVPRPSGRQVTLQRAAAPSPRRRLQRHRAAALPGDWPRNALRGHLRLQRHPRHHRAQNRDAGRRIAAATISHQQEDRRAREARRMSAGRRSRG